VKCKLEGARQGARCEVAAGGGGASRRGVEEVSRGLGEVWRGLARSGEVSRGLARSRRGLEKSQAPPPAPSNPQPLPRGGGLEGRLGSIPITPTLEHFFTLSRGLPIRYTVFSGIHGLLIGCGWASHLSPSGGNVQSVLLPAPPLLVAKNDPKPSNLSPKAQPLSPRPSTPNPQRSTLNPCDETS